MTSDPRLFFQVELARRCRANPRYSLRAFAKFLEIESSALSKILNGKRAISPTMLRKLALKLALSPDQFQELGATLVETRGRAKNGAGKATPAPNYQQLAVDHYHILSDWYHYAILELTSVEGFQPRAGWIARNLGLSLPETQLAIERLLRTGYLEIDGTGRWIDRAGHISNIRSEFTSAAMRKVQGQILAMALAALESVPIEQRDNTGMTMAIDSSLLPQAKKKIARFRRELCAFLQSGTKKDAVYQLGLALYPLSEVRSKGMK